MRSLRSKTKPVYLSACVNEYTLYAITESWLSGDILNSEIVPSDYTVLRHDRDPKTSGRKVGVGVFLGVSSDVDLAPLDLSPVTAFSPLINAVGGTCTVGTNQFLIIVVYLPPDTPCQVLENFFSSLEIIIGGKDALILGDFNIPHLGNDNIKDSKSISCSDFMYSCELRQFNNILNCNSRSLDLVISNLPITVRRADIICVKEDPNIRL